MKKQMVSCFIVLAISLVSPGVDASILFTNKPDKKIVFEPELVSSNRKVSLVVASPDDSRLLVVLEKAGSRSKSAMLFDYKTLKKVKDLQTEGLFFYSRIVSAAFSADGKKLAMSYDSSTDIYDVKSGVNLVRDSSRIGASPVVSFSPSEESLALIQPLGNNDKAGVLQFWDMEHSFRHFSHHQGRVKDFAFLPNQREIVSTATDGYTLVFDFNDRVITHALSTGPVDRVAASRDGQTIYTFGSETNQGFTVWDLSTGKERLKFGAYRVFEISTMPHQMAISHDESIVALSVDNDIHIYDLLTGEKVFNLAERCEELKTDGVTSLSFSNIGRTLIVGTEKGVILFIDLTRL